MPRNPTVWHFYVTVNGERVFFLTAGRSGPAVLCLHGRWGCSRTWLELLKRYGSRYRILSPDQRGHGRSFRPEAGFRMEDLARDAEMFLKRVGKYTPAIVVGHSMGARVAAYLAARYPESVAAVALLDETLSGTPWHRRPPFVGREDDGLTARWPVSYTSTQCALQHLRERFQRETSVAYFRHSLYKFGDGDYRFLFCRPAMASLLRGYRDWRHLLPRIRCPVLLVRAADSWCLPRTEADEMRAALADCTYAEIPGSDHLVYADNPTAFYAAFDAWLTELEARGVLAGQ